jgi:hypothetical protein
MNNNILRLGTNALNIALLLLFMFLSGNNLIAQINLDKETTPALERNSADIPKVTDPSTLNPLYDLQKKQKIKKASDYKPIPFINDSKGNSIDNTKSTDPPINTGCFIPIDGSYTAVPKNDDGYLGPINLPFSFSLYGTNYNKVFINTNGNITFNSGVSQYSADGFPFNIPMVAAFWGDVDTRGNGGQIFYKILPTHMIITWVEVGYYSYQTDKRNTFQIIIGTNDDALTGLGQNVCFHYADMQWTTGSASDGVSGFGGVPATVGINHGNGTDYVQVGRFNQNNYAYDGPGGSYDGVHYLDYQCLCFDVGEDGNIPPMAVNFPPGNTISIPSGGTQSLNLQFIAPEVNQCVTTTVNTGGLCNVSYSVTNGQTSVIPMTITGAPCNIGTHTITFTATDNGSPAETTTETLTVVIGDPIDPVIICPPPITVNNTEGECGAIVTYDIPTFTDNYSILPTYLPGYTYLGTYGGHTYFISTGTQDFMDAATEAEGVGGHLATITSQGENDFLKSTVAASSWIGFRDLVYEGDFIWDTGEEPVYTNWNTGQPDNSGNEDFGQFHYGTVGEWNDNTASVYLFWIVEFDGLGVLSPNMGLGSGSYYPVGTTTMSYTATDLAGNTDDCSFTVTVLDGENPEITCSGPIDIPNDDGECGAYVNFELDVSDNCPGVTYSCTVPDDVAGTPNGCATNTVNLSITFDDYPEETYWMILNSMGAAVEVGGPYGSEPDGSTLNLTFNLPVDDYMFFIKDSAGDGICCSYGNGSYTLSSNGTIIATGGAYGGGEMIPFCVETPVAGTPVEVLSGDLFPIGTTTVTCTATDVAGNTDVCSFDVTVSDVEPPELVVPCPQNITFCGAQNVYWVAPEATDNCGVVTTLNNYDSGDYFGVGVYNVTYTFYDEAGLSVSCGFVVTINPLPELSIDQSDLPTWCQGIKVLTAEVANLYELTYPVTYEWSNGLGSDPTVVIPSIGTYHVMVTDALGCSSTATIVIDVDISTLLSAYTIISGEEFEMYESDVLGGGVGIEDADESEVSDNSYIATFMRADADNVQVDGSSFINNFIDADFAVPFPPFRSNSYWDYNDVYVPYGGSMTLAGSRYGNIVVGAGGEIHFTNPEVYVKSLTTYKSATVFFHQPTEMMIKKKMNIGVYNVVNPLGYTSVIYVGDNATVHQGSYVTVNIYAPEGLDVNDSGATLTTHMTGMFISNDRVISDHNVIWNWNLNCSYLFGDVQETGMAQINDPTEAEENLALKEGLNIYPNPTSGLLNVDVHNYIGQTIDITIYDQLGRAVWTKHIREADVELINIDLSSGVFHNSLYLMSLQSEGQTETETFILEK